MALKHLIEAEKSNIILIQETIGMGSPLIVDLTKVLGEWYFLAIDSVGLSGGLITSGVIILLS